MSYSFSFFLRLVIYNRADTSETLLSALILYNLEIKELIFVEFVILTDG